MIEVGATYLCADGSQRRVVSMSGPAHAKVLYWRRARGQNPNTGSNHATLSSFVLAVVARVE